MVFRLVENRFESQKIESRHFYYPQGKDPTQSKLSPSKQRQITYSPQLRQRTMKTYLKIYCFKSNFLKPVT